MKRYCPVNYTGMFEQYSSRVWRCFTYGACYSEDLVSTPIVPTGDYISMFGPCFAYSRGSMRVAINPSDADWWQQNASSIWVFPSDDDDILTSASI